jgi:hypothetical protein
MHENRETSEMPVANSAAGRWAKATNQKAHVHVSEGSDSGVIPMNQPNKEEQFSAEVGEGRPLTKENTHQSSTPPTQCGECVSQGLAGVRRATPRERFDAIHPR